MKKISFPKDFEELSCEELGVENAPGVVFRFWKNPSRFVVKTIGRVVLSTAEDLVSLSKPELEKLDKEYYQAISQLIIDCNLESISFNTPEEAAAAFESSELPIGFLYEVVVGYLGHLYSFNERVKKALALFWAGSAFGKNDATEDIQLTNESGKTPSES